jgi:hypothetical protein
MIVSYKRIIFVFDQGEENCDPEVLDTGDPINDSLSVEPCPAV